MLETILRLVEKADNIEELEKIKKEYVGKKGKISLEMRNLKNLEPEDRKKKGQELGALKKKLDSVILEKADKLHIKETNKLLEGEIVDITSSGKIPHRGHFGKIQIVRKELEDILQVLGFDISYKKDLSQYIENSKLPTKSVIITKTSAIDNNSLQDTPIWKAEGMIVDTNINLSNILDIIKQISQELLGEKIKLRFRATTFPYSKSGIAGDVACNSCKQKGCKICSYTGWIEIFGIGNLDIEQKEIISDTKEDVSGEINAFVFSINITKLTATKYTIQNQKLFCNGDLRFIRS